MTGGIQSYPGSSERATLLIGQRGMGKTAMLLEIADRAEDAEMLLKAERLASDVREFDGRKRVTIASVNERKANPPAPLRPARGGAPA